MGSRAHPLAYRVAVYFSTLCMGSCLSEEFKHVQTLGVYLLRAQTGKLESAQQAGNLCFEALERGKPPLPRLGSPCAVPLVLTDG